MTSAYTINAALNYAIRTAVAQCSKSRNFSRKSSLSRETIIRLLIRFRICRFQIDSGEFETVATSLPRSFSLEDIKTLYHLRWGIETSFRDLKYTLGLVNLHCKSDSFAEQEIYSSLTAFNFASRVCREVVVRQPTEGIYAYKVNFKMAVAPL